MDALDRFVDVTTYGTIEEMERKLRGTGSAEGLYWIPSEGQCVSVLKRNREANTVFSVATGVVRQRTYRQGNPEAPFIMRLTHGVPAELADRTRISPVSRIDCFIGTSIEGVADGRRA